VEIAKLTTNALLSRLQETKKYRKIAKEILDDEDKIKDESYDVACEVFNSTSNEYFHLGFQACFALYLELILNANNTLENPFFQLED
jgi:hypothetical protein